MQTDDGTSGEPLPYLLILYPLVISQGYNIRGKGEENREEVPFRIAEDNPVGDTGLFHIGPPELLTMIGFDPLYPQNICVPGDNHDEFASQGLCLVEKINMPGMKMVKGSRADNPHTPPDVLFFRL